MVQPVSRSIRGDDTASGIFHPYYTVIMAPPVAALGGAGAVALWRLGRRSLRWAWVLPAVLAISVLWADLLLSRTSRYDRWLGPTLVVCGIVAAVILFGSMTGFPRLSSIRVVAGIVRGGPTSWGPGCVLSDDGRQRHPSSCGGGSRRWISAEFRQYGQRSRTAHSLSREPPRSASTWSPSAMRRQRGRRSPNGPARRRHGGYTGLDPAPTPAAFQHLVAVGSWVTSTRKVIRVRLWLVPTCDGWKNMGPSWRYPPTVASGSSWKLFVMSS